MVSDREPAFIRKLVTTIGHYCNVVSNGCSVVNLTAFRLLLRNLPIKLLHKATVFILACKGQECEVRNLARFPSTQRHQISNGIENARQCF
jgi:hypothetical protein